MVNLGGAITIISNELDTQRQGIPTYTAREKAQIAVLRELVDALEILGHIQSGRPLTLVREKAIRAVAKGRVA